jgi:hypothetical protein
MFAFWVILFQEIVEYMNVMINLSYGRQIVHLQACVFDCQTCAITHIMTEMLLPMVNQCILNQSNGFWLLSNALISNL